MADASSSPLSSPPESVVNVAVGTPAGGIGSISRLADLHESPEETVELKPSPPANDGPEQEPATHAPGDGGHSTAHKRKASISRKPTPAKKPRLAASAARKSAHGKKWEAPFVYADPNSPLAKADLRAILLYPAAWDMLTEEEKRDVLAKFPDESHILDAGTPDARPNLASLRNDDNFRHDCARYCENIGIGKHDEEWLRQAWVAHEKYKRGDFDEYLRKSFEEVWKTKLPDGNPRENSSSSSTPTIDPADPKQELAGPSQPVDATGAQDILPAQIPSPLSPVSPRSAGDFSPQNLVGVSGAKAHEQDAVVEQEPEIKVSVNKPEPPKSSASVMYAANRSDPSGNERDMAVTQAE